MLLKRKLDFKNFAGKPIFAEIKVDDTITIVPIDKVKEWKGNPRKNDSAVPKLANIIEQKGQITPIVVCRKTNVIYKGNTTWKALKALKKTTVKVLYADFPSERAAIAYGIADNKASEYAHWDEDLLLELFSGNEFETKETGFSEAEKNFLLMNPNSEKIQRINGAPVTMKDKIVVMIVDSTSRKEIIELLEDWIKASGLKNIEVKK